MYGSVAKVFDRVRDSQKGDSLAFDSTYLKDILSGGDEPVEALRSARADAIRAVSETSPSLMSNADK